VPFIIQYNYLHFDILTIINLLLLFVILSSLLWILLRLIIKIIRHLLTIHLPSSSQVSPLFQNKVLIPFIPAMIVAARLLLWRASFFIWIFFPGW
jgi:hypothetical protein